MGREGLAHSVGLKDTINTSAIFSKYEHVFTPMNVKLLKALLNASTLESTRRKNLLLYDYLVSCHIGNQLKELSDKANNYETSATIKVGGKSVPYRQAAVLVMNQPDRKKRQQITELVKKPKATLTKLNEEALEQEYALLKQLTGKDYVGYYEFVKGMKYDRFADDLRKFLIDTQGIYTGRLNEILAEMKIPIDDARKHDLGYYNRAHKFDRYFPKNKLLLTLKKTLAGMGFNLDRQKNIHVDASERPNKVPRAFCSTLIVPQEIHLVLKPHGGQEDYQTILHEAGHSEHFANTRDDMDYEFKHMGAHSVSESYAFLFEYLLLDPNWLQTYINMPAKAEREFLQFLWTNKLFFLRRYAGKIVYEVKLHRNDLRKLDEDWKPMREKYASAADMYADIFSRAICVKCEGVDYLIDVDSGFYSADYLKAWMFEVQIRKVLKERFGPTWFTNKKAGAFLKDLWQFGSSGMTQDELAQRIGYDKVDKRYLIEELLEAFEAH